MNLKGFKNTNFKKYSGKRKVAEIMKHTNSKENVEKNKRKNKKDVIRQTDYDELPDSVYEFSGLNELQHRKSKPNREENEKYLKQLYIIKKGKKVNVKEKSKKDIKEDKRQKNRLIKKEETVKENIIENIYESKKEELAQKSKNEKTKIIDNKHEDALNLEGTAIENIKIIDNNNVSDILDNKQDLSDNKKENEDDSSASSNNKVDDKKESNVETVKQNIDNTSSNVINNTVGNYHYEEKIADDKKIEDDKVIKENSVLEKTNNKNDKMHNDLFVFLVTVFTGIITHIVFITSNAINNQGIWNIYNYVDSESWRNALGAWGLFFGNLVVNNNWFPSIIAIASICLIGLAISMIVKFLQIENKILQCLIAMAVIVSPVLTNSLLYVYLAIPFSISFFMASIIIYLIWENNNRVLNIAMSIILTILTLEIYPSSIGLILGIAIIRIIEDLFNEKEDLKNILYHFFIIIALIIVGIIAVCIVNNSWVEISDYSLIVNHIKNSFIQIYKTFFDIYFTDNIINNNNILIKRAYVVLFLITFILELIKIINQKMWNNCIKFIILILMNLIIPLGFNFALFYFNIKEDILIFGSMILIFVLFIMMMDISKSKMAFYFKLISIVLIVFNIYNYYLLDNCTYYELINVEKNTNFDEINQIQ